jgi:hypothetical protein
MATVANIYIWINSRRICCVHARFRTSRMVIIEGREDYEIIYISQVVRESPH